MDFPDFSRARRSGFQAMLSLLGLRVGDRFDVGDARLHIDRVIAYEPDRGNWSRNWPRPWASQFGRQDNVRRGWPTGRCGGIQYPAGGWGYDARQFFRHSDARVLGRYAAKLDHVFLSASGKSPGAARAGGHPRPVGAFAAHRIVGRGPWAVVGGLAGLLAAAGASAIAWVLSNQVFDFTITLSLWPWLATRWRCAVCCVRRR